VKEAHLFISGGLSINVNASPTSLWRWAACHDWRRRRLGVGVGVGVKEVHLLIHGGLSINVHVTPRPVRFVWIVMSTLALPMLTACMAVDSGWI
jgi:hypothetical protein